MTRARLAALAVGLAAASGIVLGLLVHTVTSSARGGPALPELHGQASWKPGERPAPPFSLRDQDGALVSLARLRGRPVLLTFLDSRCRGECPLLGSELGRMLRGMTPADRPALVVVGVNPSGDTRASVAHAARSWRLAGPYRWHWLRGSPRALRPVWRKYGVTALAEGRAVTHTLALYLIDRRGFQRTGYLFPFVSSFVALDLRKLARERP